MKSERAYRQVARAESAARTRLAIIDAAVELFARVRYESLTLDAVADAAGVTRQTVIRLFGSKEGLVSAAASEKVDQVLAERESTGGVDDALDRLVASYERVATLNWNLLVQEEAFPVIGETLDAARALHRGWLEKVFAAWLPASGRERQRRLDLLFAATDFYLFKLYRRDLRMSRAATRERMGELVSATLAGFSREAS